MSGIQQLGSSIGYRNTGDLIEDAKLIIDSAQRSAHQAVNVALVVRNWLLGRRIAEEELGDATRHELNGREVAEQLAAKLTEQYGRGYTKRSLYQYVQFYRLFPEIVQTASAQSLPPLSWSHYSEHLRVGDPEARSRYVRDALEQGWAANAARLGVAYMSRMSSSTVNNGLLPDAYLASQRPSR